MSAKIRRRAVENEDISRIQREVTPLAGDIRYLPTGDLLSRRASRARAGNSAPDPISTSTTSAPRRMSMDDRFGNYISGSVETTRPVRFQRRISRNRAVVTGIFLAVLLFWAMSRFL